MEMLEDQVSVLTDEKKHLEIRLKKEQERMQQSLDSQSKLKEYQR